MKLPFNIIIGPILKPYFANTRLFCQRPTFSISIPYICVYSTLGLFINIHHLKKHLGESPHKSEESGKAKNDERRDMVVHDLKIIATSMGLIQYSCLFVGCLTENPSLFLPHLVGQLLIICVRLLNAILALVSIDLKTLYKLHHKITAILLMTFNWLQEFLQHAQLYCYFFLLAGFFPHFVAFLVTVVRTFDNVQTKFVKADYSCTTHGIPKSYILTVFQYIPFICIEHNMETESYKVLDNIRMKHENHINTINSANDQNNDGLRVKLRALLVALLGVSMSACAFASQPVELELDDEDVTQKLNNVSFARRITKPTIRLVMGYGKLSAFVTALTSILLLIAVMSKQSWWRRGARWLAAPALLVVALETTSDASDALLAAVLRGSDEPALVVAQTVAACFLITVEILVWYFIAKFFEYNPPPLPAELKKESIYKPIICNNPH